MVLFLSFSLLADEYGGLSTNNLNGYPSYIILDEGDILEILSCSSDTSISNSLVLFSFESQALDMRGNAYDLPGYLTCISTSEMIDRFSIFVGPLAIKLYRNPSTLNLKGSHFFTYYKLIKASEYSQNSL